MKKETKHGHPHHLIIIELEDVLCDVTHTFISRFGVHPRRITKTQRQQLIRSCSQFFSDAGLKEEGLLVWEVLQILDFKVLISVADDEHVESKKAWCRQHLSSFNAENVVYRGRDWAVQCQSNYETFEGTCFFLCGHKSHARLWSALGEKCIPLTLTGREDLRGVVSRLFDAFEGGKKKSQQSTLRERLPLIRSASSYEPEPHTTVDKQSCQLSQPEREPAAPSAPSSPWDIFCGKVDCVALLLKTPMQFHFRCSRDAGVGEGSSPLLRASPHWGSLNAIEFEAACFRIAAEYCAVYFGFPQEFTRRYLQWKKIVLNDLPTCRDNNVYPTDDNDDICSAARLAHLVFNLGRISSLHLEVIPRSYFSPLFQSWEHVCSFDRSRQWFYLVIHELSKAKRAKTKNAVKGNFLLYGEIGRCLSVVVQPIESSCLRSLATTLRDRDGSPRHAKSNGVAGNGEKRTNSLLSTFCCQWSDEENAQCDQAFLDAKLYYLKPIWPVVKGICLIISGLAAEATRYRNSQPQYTALANQTALDLLWMLLWTKLDYRNVYQDMLSRAKDNLTLASFHMRPMGHIFPILCSVRGFCWEKLLTLVKRVGYAAAEVDRAWRLALDDPYLSEEYKVSLSQRKHFEQEQSVVRCPLMSPRGKGKSRDKTAMDSIIDITPEKKRHRLVGNNRTTPKDATDRSNDFNKVEMTRTTTANRVPATKGGRIMYQYPAIVPCIEDWKGLSKYLTGAALSIRSSSLIANLLSEMFPALCVEQLAMMKYFSEIHRCHPDGSSILLRSLSGRIDVECGVGDEIELARTELAVDGAVEVGLEDIQDDIQEDAEERGVGFEDAAKENVPQPDVIEEPASKFSRLEKNMKSIPIKGYSYGAVANELTGAMWIGCWSESFVWTTALVLLFWEEICARDLPYTFFPLFSQNPLDFLPEACGGWGELPPVASPGFYVRRKEKICERMKSLLQLNQAQFQDEIQQCYRRHKGEPFFNINWNKCDSEEIVSFCLAVGMRRLSVVFESMLHFPEVYGRGMPDLLFWKHSLLSSDAEGAAAARTLNRQGGPVKTLNEPWVMDDVFAVEVKSEKDVVSRWQTLWLELLQRANIPCEILKVYHNPVR